MPSTPFSISSSSSTPNTTNTATIPNPTPIVYTIAGSDSSGGAGIQADLHTINAMGCYGCTVITCLTAQNTLGVTAVHPVPGTFIRSQLNALMEDDLRPMAIKIGMLNNAEVVGVVGEFLRDLKEAGQSPVVVLDPVMVSTSGHQLIDDAAREAMIQHVFPYCDVLTPNLQEAEALLGRELYSFDDVERGARDLLNMMMKTGSTMTTNGDGKSVLIKGGHRNKNSNDSITKTANEEYAQDYVLSSPSEEYDGSGVRGEGERVCDGNRGVWIRSPRIDTVDTHGTGCTLSSAIASALALGRQGRADTNGVTGAIGAIQVVDACCLAKAYVTAGIQHAGNKEGIGRGPSPVRHTHFPNSWKYFPSIVSDPATSLLSSDRSAFLPMRAASSTIHKNVRNNHDDDQQIPILGRLLPIVDSIEWVERLYAIPGITDIQLRIKNEMDPKKIQAIVDQCQKLCASTGVRLWINDHWEAAVSSGCFGVHLGQEDLVRSDGGLEIIREKGIAFGVSTYSYADLSVALGLRPSYISIGPVFATKSKDVKVDPQGLEIVSDWRELVPPDVPLVAIGGINDPEKAGLVINSGADCVSVISAITKSENVEDAVSRLLSAIS